MISVGVRQLKNNLTRYLRVVGEGQTVLVNNRKRPVAVLKRPDRDAALTQEERLAALTAEGKILPASLPGPFRIFKPVAVKGKPASRIILEDRR